MALLLLWLALFLVALAYDAPRHPFLFTVLGAKDRELVAQGQLWRLLTAPLLHGSWGHLLVNGVALGWLGFPLERRLGSARFLILFVLSALGGSLASLWLTPGPSLGASGGLAGLLGVVLVLAWRGRGELGWTPLLRSLPVLVLLGLCGWLTQRVDHAAHLGGLLGGCSGAWLLPRTIPLRATRVARGWLVAAAGAALLLLLALAGSVLQLLPLRWLPGGAPRVHRAEAGDPVLHLRGPWTPIPRAAGAPLLWLRDGVSAQVQVEKTSESMDWLLTDPATLVVGGTPEQFTGWTAGSWPINASRPGLVRWVRVRYQASPEAPPLQLTLARLELGARSWSIRLEVLERMAYRYGDLLGEVVTGLAAGSLLLPQPVPGP